MPQIGVLICMEAPTKPMLKEAAEAGFYKPLGLEHRCPRVQILTIEELLGVGVRGCHRLHAPLQSLSNVLQRLLA